MPCAGAKVPGPSLVTLAVRALSASTGVAGSSYFQYRDCLPSGGICNVSIVSSKYQYKLRLPCCNINCIFHVPLLITLSLYQYQLHLPCADINCIFPPGEKGNLLLWTNMYLWCVCLDCQDWNTFTGLGELTYDLYVISALSSQEYSF